MTDLVNQPVSDPNPDNVEDTHGTVLIGDPSPVAPVVPDATEQAVTYEPTGDVGLDMALEFVGKAGLHGNHPAMQAAANGDFSILKATLAQKGVAGWEQMVALGEAAYGRTKEADAAKATALQELVHNVAGGKEEWTAVQQWAKANATQEERDSINALLNQGGVAAKGAVNYLVNAYNRANNVVKEPQDGMAGAGRTVNQASGANAPLSPREYAVAVQQLNGRMGGRLEGSKEYAALQQRRSAYKG